MSVSSPCDAVNPDNLRKLGRWRVEVWLVIYVAGEGAICGATRDTRPSPRQRPYLDDIIIGMALRRYLTVLSHPNEKSTYSFLYLFPIISHS